MQLQTNHAEQMTPPHGDLQHSDVTARKVGYRTVIGVTIAAPLICLFLLSILLRLYAADVRVPFGYGGDSLYILSLAKNISEGHWLWHNPHLGAPVGADLRDFPVGITADASLMKIISFVTDQPGAIVNLHWLLAICLTAATAAFGLHRLGVHPWVAVCLGNVYALQPYTYYRNIAHLNLVFYLVPLLAAGIIELTLGRSSHSGEPDRPGIRGIIRQVPLYLWAACILQGLSYIYNSFFAVYLILVCSVLAVISIRNKKTLMPYLAVIGVLITFSAVNLLPSLSYWRTEGKNPSMAYKQPLESEVYGLKIRHLLTPVPGHAIPVLRNIANKFIAANFPNENENASARLGLLGTVGFFILICVLLLRTIGWDFRLLATHANVIGLSAVLLLCCLLLATVGGLGSVFNTLISADIRCYNRIVVFISFFCLLPVGLILSDILMRWRGNNLLSFAGFAAMGGLAALAVADQIPPHHLTPNDARQREFYQDKGFVEAIEKKLPANAAVFQLPYTNFPLDGGMYKMYIYDHAKPYLHSHQLRWSWGGMTGRPAGDWSQKASQLPVPLMLTKIIDEGFDGLWIDRWGYEDNIGPAKQISALLQAAPLIDQNGRFIFYDLTHFRNSSSDEHHTRSSEPIKVEYEGCFPEENTPSGIWRWCGKQATMILTNTQGIERRAEFLTVLHSGDAKPETITISAGSSKEIVPVSANTTGYKSSVAIPPHSQVKVQFRYSGHRLITPNDSRHLYFTFINSVVVER